MVNASPQELAITAAQMQASRLALMEQAHRQAINCGFVDRQARFMAVTGLLLGAAQAYAVSQHGGIGMYEIFKAMAAVMATSDAKKVVMEGKFDFGPEAAAGGLVMPPGFKK